MSTLMIATTAALLTALYFVVILLEVIIRNHKAHKFFQTKSPELPVVPGANFFTGHALGVLAPRKNWKIIEDLHEKYGPTFGFYMMDQPWVSTKDLDLLKHILLDEGHTHTGRQLLGIPFKEFNHSIQQTNGEKWRRGRRAMSPALTNLKVRSDDISLHIEVEVDLLAASMKRRLGKVPPATDVDGDSTSEHSSLSMVADMNDLFKRFGLAIIIRVFYNQSDIIDYDVDRDSFTDEVFQMGVDVINPLTYTGMAVPKLRPLCEWLQQFTTVGRTKQKLVDFIESSTNLGQKLQISREKAASGGSGGGGGDKSTAGQDCQRRLVDLVIDSSVEKKINYDGIMGSLFMLLLAGFTTTADTMTCMVWHLARNPEIQERLRRTIMEEGIDADYVMCCIREAIRYHPAAPLGMGRILASDVEINGLLLAKGSFVSPTTHGIHHDPEVWPEPERFNPDRWREQANFHPAAFMAFGLGPRNCIGDKLAYQEIKLVMRMILTNFSISTCDETLAEWSFSSPAVFYTQNDHPSIKLRFTALDSPAVATAATAATGGEGDLAANQSL